MDTNEQQTHHESHFDYSYVSAKARIAIYEDGLSAPRIIEIKPNKTADFIEDLASTVHRCAKQQGGSIPYTAIREVSENYIHAQFQEIVVSIFNEGKTIRFADQGPGISNKEKAQLPGFSSAIEPMKEYIRGVGSGLPIVKEYLNFTNGTITIEDNLVSGAVVTISQDPITPVSPPDKQPTMSNQPEEEQSTREIPDLTEREKVFISFLASNGALGVSELSALAGTAPSSTHSTLSKLEKKGLVRHDSNKKRLLTKFGSEIAKSL